MIRHSTIDAIHHKQRLAGGFTLLELMVSITILSLIITISYSALRMGTRSWDASIQNIDKNTNIRSAIELIKNKVEQIYPMDWRVNGKQVIAFQGDREAVKFIAPSPQGRELGEYFEYFFVIDKGMEDSKLMLYYEPHDPDVDEFLVNWESPNRVILDGLKGGSFAFFGKTSTNNQEEWSENWGEDSRTLPSAVQIILTGQEEQGINIDIVVKLRSELHQL
jgi:general secretion pathway protein J